MQMIRHVIGTEGEQVIGCLVCGEVAHLQPDQRHRCSAASSQVEILQPARIVNAIPDNAPER